MYECPNCAANMKFHIGKQMLFCEACDTSMDPYAFQKKEDAKEMKYFETTVFICPQCGGELIADDDTAATFCSYCGGSTILDSRISREKMPRYIIPFQKDKEDCKKAYRRMLRYAYFVPKELKDPEQIERFRPIYMPFWLYSLKYSGALELKDPNIYHRKERLFAAYRGFFYDASAAFSDDLANGIWPFHPEQKKAFTPSFLSGFYADVGDVDKDLYVEEARELAIEDTLERIRKEPHYFRDSSTGTWKLLPEKEAIDFKLEAIDRVMFPVWFLAWRKKDRVAYAVVNGQTGKIAGDMPIDVRKYLLSSWLGAIPVFLLLYSYWNMSPGALLAVSALLSFVCSVVSNIQLSYLIIRDNREKDKGFMSRQESGRLVEDKSIAYRIPTKLLGVILLAVSIIWIPALAFLGYVIDKYTGVGDLLALPLVLLLGLETPAILFLCRVSDQYLNHRKLSLRIRMEQFMYGRRKLPYLIKPFVGIVIAVVLLCLAPTSEVWYYAGAFVCMILTGVTIVNIIRYHNLLTTRKLPQLKRRGGDENA